MEDSGLFKIYREVPGYYIQRRLHQEEKNARIDRVLSPRDSLIRCGWQHGPIGIEVKAPGTKAGPAIAQMLDYSRAVWTIPSGFNFYLSWIFLWHLEVQTNTVASILAQHRLGTACTSPWEMFTLASGQVSLLRIRRDNEVLVGKATNGRRAGSR